MDIHNFGVLPVSSAVIMYICVSKLFYFIYLWFLHCFFKLLDLHKTKHGVYLVAEVEEMESDEEDHLMVTVGNQKYAVNEVTEELVSKMTPEEKEAYIRLTQDLYASIYE